MPSTLGSGYRPRTHCNSDRRPVPNTDTPIRSKTLSRSQLGLHPILSHPLIKWPYILCFLFYSFVFHFPIWLAHALLPFPISNFLEKLISNDGLSRRSGGKNQLENTKKQAELNGHGNGEKSDKDRENQNDQGKQNQMCKEPERQTQAHEAGGPWYKPQWKHDGIGRPVRSWPISRYLMVRGIRHVMQLVPRTGLRLGGTRSDKLAAPFWLRKTTFTLLPPPRPELVKGPIRKMCQNLSIPLQPVPCYWHHKTPASFVSTVFKSFVPLWESSGETHNPVNEDSSDGKISRAEKIKERRAGDDHNEADDGDGLVVLHLHGGAYVVGDAGENDYTANVVRGLFDTGYVSRVLAVDYRLVDHAPFPGALVDAIGAYSYLLDTLHYDPRQIVIEGDSAGGNLALALVRYIRDEGVLPMPQGVLLFSPWCDLTFSQHRFSEDSTSHSNWKCDILDSTLGPFARRLFLRHLPPNIVRSPYISPAALPWPSFDIYTDLDNGISNTHPVSDQDEKKPPLDTEAQLKLETKPDKFLQAPKWWKENFSPPVATPITVEVVQEEQELLLTPPLESLLQSQSSSSRRDSSTPSSVASEDGHRLFEGFPPTWILAGGCERLLDEIKVLVERMQNRGHDENRKVEFRIQEGGMHDFLTFPWVEPERTESLKIVKQWLEVMARRWVDSDRLFTSKDTK